MESINLSQIQKIVSCEIRSQLSSKQQKAKYQNPNQKERSYQIALFELKVMRKIFAKMESNQELETLASLETKAEMLEENIARLTKKDDDTNKMIQQLRLNNKAKTQTIEKLERRVETFSKKSQLFDKVGGKSRFQQLESQNKMLKQQLNKVRQKYSKCKQNVVELESKLQIYKNMNTSQQIKLAQLTLQINQIHKQNKNVMNKTKNTQQNCFNQSAQISFQTKILNSNNYESQSSENRITIMSLKQQNIQLKRQNQKLTERFELQTQEWSERENQYAKMLKKYQTAKNALSKV